MLEPEAQAETAVQAGDQRFVPIVLKKSEILRGQFFGECQLCRQYHPNARRTSLTASYKEKWL
jgi:hypothetical protein